MVAGEAREIAHRMRRLQIEAKRDTASKAETERAGSNNVQEAGDTTKQKKRAQHSPKVEETEASKTETTSETQA